MSAREQAREAVRNASWNDEGPRRWPESVEHLADTASDVWEPIVRDLLKVAKHLRVTANDGVYDHAIAQAREALDDPA